MDVRRQYRYLDLGILLTNSIQTFVYDPHTTSSNEETFLQENLEERFSSKFEAFASDLLENLEKMFPWYYSTK